MVILLKIVQKSYNNAPGVDTSPQSLGTRAVSYAPRAYTVFMEGVVV
jgi:hypothetical protein